MKILASLFILFVASNAHTHVEVFEEEENPFAYAHYLNREMIQCGVLPPGYERLHEKGIVGSTYLLKRISDNVYEANVAVNFTQAKNRLNPVKVKPEEMMRHVKSCIALANNHYLGPKGESLKIRILDQIEVKRIPEKRRPGVNEIEILDPKQRSHSKGYSESIDCRTVAHEILHLVGLVDEYLEVDPKFNYNCRVVTRTNSIMKNVNIFDEVVLKENGFKPTKSLLLPSQFKKIVSNICDPLVLRYNQCSHFAYRKNHSCHDVPSECRKDAYYLGIKP